VTTRQELVDTVRGFIERADRIAAGLSPADWKKTTYEQGWTVKQAYCHLASLGRSIPFYVCKGHLIQGSCARLAT
jgi:hypothetical protein